MSEYGIERDFDFDDRYRLYPIRFRRGMIFALALKRFLLFPLRLVQFALRRLMTHLILNPLFRKQEKPAEFLDNNTKYPDPLINADDKRVIINIEQSESMFFHAMRRYAHWFRYQLGLLFPGVESKFQFSEVDFSAIIKLVDDALNKGFEKDKIYFKGLYRLSKEDRLALFKQLEQKYHYAFDQSNRRLHFYTLKSMDGVELDSVEIRPESHALISERKFVIACLPRTQNYQTALLQYQQMATQLDTTVIGFNYRGVAKSHGLLLTSQDMINDATHQVQRLLALGAKPENIALMGECLGGSIATKVAAQFHREHLPVKLMNIRSFRSLSSLIEGHLRPLDKNAFSMVSLMRYFFAKIVMLVVNVLLFLSGWYINVEKDWKAIPAQDKDFIVVRSRKNDKKRHYRDDPMIQHAHASLYSLVKEEQLELKKRQEAGESLTAEEKERLCDARGAHKFYVNPDLRKNAQSVDGHRCHLRYLKPKKSELPVKDAREYVFFSLKAKLGRTKNGGECLAYSRV